jgi:DUF1680 family protein
MRLYASLQHYTATSHDHAIQIHQYADAEMLINLLDGEVTLTMETFYPWDGVVSFSIELTPPSAWALMLRIPTWAQGWAIYVNDEPIEAKRGANGYATIEREWEVGDKIVLELPIEPRWIAANPRVDAIRGCVALERGPLLYGFESHDQPTDVELADVQVCTNEPVAVADTEAPGGSVALEAAGRMPDEKWGGDLYRPLVDAPAEGAGRTVSLTAIPYYAWGNRGIRSMRVWLPKAP